MDESARLLSAFLDSVGLTGDPELAGTPERVAELLASFRPAPLPPLTVCATTSDVPVVVRDIPFHSMCAHHLLPFFGRVSIAYRPGRTLLGLGALPRVVAHFARRLQLQERLAEQIADALMERAAPRSAVVAVVARHLCVEMRGPETHAEVEVVVTRGAPDDWLRSRVG